MSELENLYAEYCHTEEQFYSLSEQLVLELRLLAQGDSLQYIVDAVWKAVIAAVDAVDSALERLQLAQAGFLSGEGSFIYV